MGMGSLAGSASQLVARQDAAAVLLYAWRGLRDAAACMGERVPHARHDY
jgi:hypothetical protein